MVTVDRHPGCLVSILWFIFVGSWASLIWSLLAWILIALVVTMPLGLIMLNRLPKIATLRPQRAMIGVVVDEGGTLRLRITDVPQRPFWLRALWFILAGWWLSFFWILIAWLASITLVGIPLAMWMYNRVPAVVTLRRY
jgi:uncharacterized membrane protein YccF (DUF307 family)